MPRALTAFKRFKEENDRIFDQEKARRLEPLERRYQSEKHEKEIIELKQGEADHAIELVRQRSQRNLVAGGAALSALVGFGLYRRRVESARICRAVERHRHAHRPEESPLRHADDRRGNRRGAAPAAQCAGRRAAGRCGS